MPCRVSFECPCCGNETGTDYSIAQAVDKMQKAFRRLQEHHKGLDERVERAERMRESAENALGRQNDKLKAAVADRDKAVARQAEVEQMKNGARDLWLRDFSDDELLDELTRRRHGNG